MQSRSFSTGMPLPQEGHQPRRHRARMTASSTPVAAKPRLLARSSYAVPVPGERTAEPTVPPEESRPSDVRGTPARTGSYPSVAEFTGGSRVCLWMSDTTLTRDAWDQLLRALDPDVAQAAARYERLRGCLIALYRGRALPDPEDLADQALDGVARALTGGGHDLGGALREVARAVGDAARHAHRAHAIALAALPAAAGPHDPDEALARLCRCLDELPELDRESLLVYEGADGDRSHRRRALAAELGIPLNALRVRMHRLRVRLLARLGGARPVALRLGEPVADREQLDVPALRDPAPRAARREQREPDRRRAQADQVPGA